MRSHAAIPHAEPVEGSLFRIYFTARDETNRGRTFSLIWDCERPDEVVDLQTAPFLDLGELGGFDDSGAILTWITPINPDESYYYYVGWNLGVTVPLHNSLGVAKGSRGRIVQRYRGPTMDRTLMEPHFVGSACVLREESGKFRNWYLSCQEWTLVNGSPRHRYHIKQAESSDGLNWIRSGAVAIDFASNDEFAISRPCVLRDPDQWRIWYSYRGTQYRIGYAESEDGTNWIRMDDNAGICVSENGWDSKAIAYPYVFDYNGARFMLYNGNDYGRTGFGVAVLA